MDKIQAKFDFEIYIYRKDTNIFLFVYYNTDVH